MGASGTASTGPAKEHWSGDQPPGVSPRGLFLALEPTENLLAPGENSLTSRENLLAPRENLLEPRENLLAPRENLLEPTENLLVVDPGNRGKIGSNPRLISPDHLRSGKKVLTSIGRK